MKGITFFIASFFLFGVLNAQQNIGIKNKKIVSPQVNSDNTVTFRLNAPEAKQVIVTGDWEINKGKLVMSKDGSGIWTATSSILSSDLYRYNFNIDGVRILDPANPYQFRDVDWLFSSFVIRNGNGDYYCVNDTKHGTVIKTWYYSDNYQKDRRITIYTPPGYETRDKRYPVLYLLHGSGGDEQAWEELGRVNQIIDNLISEKLAEPMLIVMPNGNPSKQAAPGFTNDNFNYIPASSKTFPGYKDGSYERSFDEIVAFIDSNYRTINKKSARAIAGLSMGGFHTLMISANHPTLFDYVGLFSPGLNYKFINMELPTYKNLNQKLTKQKELGCKLYWIAIGKDDFLYDPTQDYIRNLKELDFPFIYEETSRGHIWSNWRNYLMEFTPLLFQ